MKRGKRHSGQGLVELALALPVLLLILLGTVDLGRMFFDYIEIRNAAREGAGYLARHPNDPGEAANRAEAHGIPDVASVLPPSCSPIACSAIEPGQESEARVVITSTFTPIAAGLFQSFGIGPIALEVEASMRVMS